MNYALILDNNQYQFVKLITTEKKHSVVQLFEQTTDKKIKNDNLMLSFTSDPRNFEPALQQLRVRLPESEWQGSVERSVLLAGGFQSTPPAMLG